MPLLPITHVLSLWLVVAVALTVPVIGWCASARHQGQGLHAIFHHVHTIDTPSEHLALDHATIPFHDHGGAHEHEEAGSTWTSSSVFGGTSATDAVQALVPIHLTAIPMGGDTRFFPSLARPPSFIPAPVAPPPRPSG
jgi:hypothetical protein